MNNCKKFLGVLASLLIILSGCQKQSDSMSLYDLKVNGVEANLTIDTPEPMMQWKIQSDENGVLQKKYRILVSTDPESLNAGQGDVWDSGTIRSNACLVEYAGSKLQSTTTYYWKVQVWDSHNHYAWSKVSTFETAFLNSSDWKAQWIDDGKLNPVKDEDLYKDDPAPLFRKSFKVDKKVAKARLYITGVGYYVPYLNGRKIGDKVLDPAWSDYKDRVYYSVFDVTSQVKQGANAMAVALGNGWFNPLPLRMWGHRNIRKTVMAGRPAFISQLHITFEDGTEQVVLSDKSWKVAEGPVLKNSVYLGETYDARKEVKGWNQAGFNDSKWSNASLSPAKFGRLQAQFQNPIRVTGVVKPVKVTKMKRDVYIVDMGINFTGLVKLNLQARKGAKISFRYGELVRENGELNPMTTVCGQIKGFRGKTRESVGGPGAPEIAWANDVYIAKGEGTETFFPEFTFHAFRYVEITGLKNAPELKDIVGYRMHSDVEKVGDFSCSDDMFNKIQKITTSTFRNNIVSVQSDCPHRERFGYGGDIVATSEAFLYNFDMSRFYSKTVIDFTDGRVDGVRFPDTAPFVGVDYCGIVWAMAQPVLQLNVHKYYGDTKLMAEQYQYADKWMDQVREKNPDFLVKNGLSDHEGMTRNKPEVLVTPMYYYCAEIMAEMAQALGKTDDVEKYGTLKKNIAAAYLAKHFNKETGVVGEGTQAAQAFALKTGIIPEEYKDKVLKVLVNDIMVNRKGHLSTGILATKFMLDQLSANGYHDVAMTIVGQKDYPGWAHMILNGATTLWEHWSFSDSTFSHDHPMFGSVSEWFYKWLGGIQQKEGSTGFDHVLICPAIDKSNLNWVKCSYNSIHGPIVSNWEKSASEIRMEVQIPCNSVATIVLPQGAKTVECNGKRVKAADNELNVESGKYSIVLTK